MASTAPTPLKPFLTTTTSKRHRPTTIRCGPRDARGPLLKGRILSTEAIQAIQGLKRAHRRDPQAPVPTHGLSRLLKSDLAAALKELLRQDHCSLALAVFSTLRSEYGADLDAHADLVLAFERNGLTEEIDELIKGMVEQGMVAGGGGSKGLLRLVQALIRAGRKESTVRIYGVMRKGWMEEGFRMDEYLGMVLSKGLRRFGEVGMADEVDRELRRLYKGVFVK